MDNWDFFEQNLQVAQQSEGTLEEQANVYAESWEAATKRVKAVAENIYQNLLDDKFFINLSDTFAKILDFINKLINALGGVQGLIAGAGSLILKLYGNQLFQGIEKLIYNFKMLSQTRK